MSFKTKFDKYACVGDSIECKVGKFRIVARLEHDSDRDIDDDDCHNTDQSVTGCNDEQFAKLLAAREAWKRDEWSYVGVVLSVYKNGIELDDCAASLWGIEMNYPGGDGNAYLAEVANELLPEALETAKQVIEQINA